MSSYELWISMLNAAITIGIWEFVGWLFDRWQHGSRS